MPGTLHIFRLDPENEPAGKLEPLYQVNYATPGSTYGRTYTESKLKDFVRFTLALNEDGVMRVIRQLHDSRQVTISDVEIPIGEVGELGMDQIPGDS